MAETQLTGEHVIELHRTVHPTSRVTAQREEPYVVSVFCNARHIVRVTANDSGGSNVVHAASGSQLDVSRYNETAEEVARLMRGY